VQNVGSAGRASIGFTVTAGELAPTLAVLAPLAATLGAQVQHEESLSKVSIVGTGMRTHTGVAERMFAALAEAGVNLKMITTGDIKISVLVSRVEGVKALRAVHQAFQLDKARPRIDPPAVSLPSPHRPRPNGPTEEAAVRDVAAIAQRLSSMEDIVVSEVSLDTDQGRITIFHLPDQAGVCSRVFQAVAAANIVVDMIVQNGSGPGRAQISFSVPRQDVSRALEVTRDLARSIDSAVEVAADPDIARLIVLGIGMRTHTGVARRMFGALAERGINISMINTSEVRITVVVDRPRGEQALTALRQAFNIV
jgi:aspartate kinase